MLTIEALQKDMMSAMKAGDTIRKSALSNAVAAVKKAAIDNGCRDNITEELIITVLRKEVKMLTEQIETCASRPDMVDEFYKKRAVINEYVPQLITSAAVILEMITSACEGIEFTKSNKGLIMKTIAPQFKGRVDMKIAQEVLNNLLV